MGIYGGVSREKTLQPLRPLQPLVRLDFYRYKARYGVTLRPDSHETHLETRLSRLSLTLRLSPGTVTPSGEVKKVLNLFKECRKGYHSCSANTRTRKPHRIGRRSCTRNTLQRLPESIVCPRCIAQNSGKVSVVVSYRKTAVNHPKAIPTDKRIDAFTVIKA